MKYKFTNKVFGQVGIYGIEYDSLPENERAMFEINSYIWTPQEVQDILTEIENIEGDESFNYQVEGGHLGISIYSDEAYFFDLTGGKEEEDFNWPILKFVEFLNDFKIFLEKNPKP